MSFTPLSASDIPVKVYPIHQMPSLIKRLDRSRAARVLFAQIIEEHEGPRVRNLKNTVFEEMQKYGPDDDSPVDDIIWGIARLDHYPGKVAGKPLNTRNMYSILQCMPVISTGKLMIALEVGERRAQVYLKALKIAIRYLEKYFDTLKKQNPILALAPEDAASISADLWLEPFDFD